MHSIRQHVTIEWEVKRSRFIAHLIPVEHLDAVEKHLRALRHAHPDASHHCSAYVLGAQGDVQKSDDDGEPSQTAGLPILEVLRKHALTHVLCVVIRYYGGIKLGAGGLIRAYAKSTALAVKEAEMTVPETFLTLTLDVSFAIAGKLEGFLREQTKVTDVRYGTDVTFIVELLEDAYPVVAAKVRDMSAGAAHFTIVARMTRFRVMRSATKT